MRRYETTAYARAGLVGNPSDGYFGKTISFTMRNFAAHVVIYEWPTIEILPSSEDHMRFDSLSELAEDVARNGYYGGLRLVAAAIKMFHDYCTQEGFTLSRRNFTIRYSTNVPRQVGLAGSSAIVTATFRALMNFFQVNIPGPILPDWVMNTELKELGIGCGLQDRVAQCYEGLVYMDFDRDIMEREGHGVYEHIDPEILPPLYVAYKTELAEISGVMHNDLRERWQRGERKVHDAMREFAALTDRARACLVEHRPEQLADSINANFDLRRSIIPIRDEHVAMVETARSCGASAKFAGSGGAIVGTYPDENVLTRLRTELKKLNCTVILPRI